MQMLTLFYKRMLTKHGNSYVCRTRLHGYTMSRDKTGADEGTSRRKVIQTIGAGTAATALAGCGDLVGGGSGGSDALTIGHIGPSDNVLGLGSERTAEMAVERLNENGGVMDQDVELLTGNTQVNPAEAESVLDEMINQEEIDVVVGAFQSEVAQAVIDFTAEFDVPYLGTGPASPALTRDFTGEDYEQYKNYFRVGPINSDLQAEAMAGYAQYLSDRHGWNALTMYRDQASWTERFGELLPGYLNERGLEIVEQSPVTIESPDLSPLVSNTLDSEADYMLRFFAHISSSPSGILAEWHQAQHPFGVEGIHVPGMHPEYDIATEGICVYETTSQTGAGGAAPITDYTLDFIEQYRERYAEEEFDPSTPDGSPMYMGFSTYDAVQLLGHVGNEIGTTDFSGNLDDFVDQMLQTTPDTIDAVAGELEFYGPDEEFPHDLKEVRNSDGAITNFPVTQWQPNPDGDRPGSLECVFPENYRTAEHVQPAWMQ